MAQGAHVVGAARRIERLDHLAADLGEAFTPYRTDVTVETDVVDLVDSTFRAHGRLDILVNNAGGGSPNASLLRGDTASWRHMLELNILGLSLATREAARVMLHAEKEGQPPGHILNLSSMAGHRIPNTDMGFYSACKFAVRALTEVLRMEMRSEGSLIRVSSVSPGLVKSEFAAGIYGDERRAEDTYAEAAKREALMTSDDAAAVVEWILTSPPHVAVHDVLVRPTGQVY